MFSPQKEYAMIKKTLSLSLLSAVALVSIPMVAMAYPHSYGHHDGYHRGAYCQVMPELNEEQTAQLDKFRDERRNALRPLYDKLEEKRLELRALSPNPNVKPEELKAITAEIADLRKQIRDVEDDFYANMIKAGLPCRGYHHNGAGWGDAPRHGYGCGYWR